MVSVDLDEVDCYAAIHGLAAPAGAAAHAVYDCALGRFEEFLGEEALRATFFVVGRDLARQPNREAIARLHRAGHEIGNHTMNHLYDLTRRSRVEMQLEVEAGACAIAEVAGALPVGFRAPGYTVTDELLEVLAELGVGYDSSVFPCPVYWVAKAVMVGAMALGARRSRSIIGDPRVLLSPPDPYHAGRPYWRRGTGVLELPIGVTRNATGRLPFIGTSVVLAGEQGAARLSRLIAGRPLVQLELHGMDLAEAFIDGLGFLERHQPDLRRPVAQKRAALRAALCTLRAAGYRFVTAAEAALAWQL